MIRIGHRRSGTVPRQPGGHQRGVISIELALVALLLFVMLAGAFDYGQGWRSGLAVNEAARTGARVGSARGTERDADYYALSGAKAALASSGKLEGVQRVVIFQGTGVSSKPPQTCLDATPSGPCHVFTGDGFRDDWESAAYDEATTANGCLEDAVLKNWCPTDRNGVQLSADYVGVHIVYRHEYFFPVLGDGTDVARTAVMRIEPKIEDH